MSFISSILGGSYIDIVRKYIEKIFVHESNKFQIPDSDFDLVIRKVDGVMRMFIVGKNGQLLEELKDKETEKILTGKI